MTRYYIMMTFIKSDYTLLRRETKYDPFIVAWNFTFDLKYGFTWGQGHYFQTLEEATNFLAERIETNDKVTNFNTNITFRK